MQKRSKKVDAYNLLYRVYEAESYWFWSWAKTMWTFDICLWQLVEHSWNSLDGFKFLSFTLDWNKQTHMGISKLGMLSKACNVGDICHETDATYIHFLCYRAIFDVPDTKSHPIMRSSRGVSGEVPRDSNTRQRNGESIEEILKVHAERNQWTFERNYPPWNFRSTSQLLYSINFVCVSSSDVEDDRYLEDLCNSDVLIMPTSEWISTAPLISMRWGVSPGVSPCSFPGHVSTVELHNQNLSNPRSCILPPSSYFTMAFRELTKDETVWEGFSDKSKERPSRPNRRYSTCIFFWCFWIREGKTGSKKTSLAAWPRAGGRQLQDHFPAGDGLNKTCFGCFGCFVFLLGGLMVQRNIPDLFDKWELFRVPASINFTSFNFHFFWFALTLDCLNMFKTIPSSLSHHQDMAELQLRLAQTEADSRKPLLRLLDSIQKSMEWPGVRDICVRLWMDHF